jgi:hypothetical protein
MYLLGFNGDSTVSCTAFGTSPVHILNTPLTVHFLLCASSLCGSYRFSENKPQPFCVLCGSTYKLMLFFDN